MFHDPVTGAPLWLDGAQPLIQVDATVALLRVWRTARPQLVWVDIYLYQQVPGAYQWVQVRN